MSEYGASTDLVPVQALLAEQRPGKGSIIVMKDGSFRMIISSGSVNFDMKDPLERQALTLAFGTLVNSLDKEFPLQILSRSKEIDIDQYVHQFDNRLQNNLTPPKLKPLMRSHQMHFERQVKQDKMLQREIYLVIPWKGTKGPLEASVIDEVPGAALFKRFSENLDAKDTQIPSDMDIDIARQQLEIRSDQILSALSRIGVEAHRLSEEEVRKLLYSVFHPVLSEHQRDPGVEGDFTGGFSAYGQPQPNTPPQILGAGQ